MKSNQHQPSTLYRVQTLTRVGTVSNEVVRTDGSVEKAEEKRENDKSGVPVTSAGYSSNAEIHKDDRLRH